MIVKVLENSLTFIRYIESKLSKWIIALKVRKYKKRLKELYNNEKVSDR